jgi:hypothetical protein
MCEYKDRVGCICDDRIGVFNGKDTGGVPVYSNKLLRSIYEGQSLHARHFRE